MKAILMHTVGGPELLSLAEVPTPTLHTTTDMVVRLKAAGVNPVDTKLRSRGTYFPDRLPTILGCDGAGIVEQVGSGVTRFKVGDELYFCNGGIGGHPGNYAEYTTVDEKFAALKPRSLDFAHAAAAPLVLITAWESLHDRAAIQSGDRVLIHAGAGGVGHVAIQLAKLHGARVATTVSSGEKARFVSACAWSVARTKNLRIGFELMLTPMHQQLLEKQQHHAHILTRCAELIDAGQLTLHLHSRYPLAQAAAAHRRLEEGGITGKIVLTMEDE
ncbi:MAG: alcohol dehydrogenase [Halothiobacillaceae bacterium]|nr:MAG: alcohol dehydrogenase [Halothiobacillaceae bacterium]